MENKVVSAILPAYNEESNIASAIGDLIEQTYKLDSIIIVDDLSHDNTSKIVKILANYYSDYLPITLLKTNSKNLRAGAINVGLRYIKKHIPNCEYVLIADADSRFDKHLVREGIKSLEKDVQSGGVCSTAGVLNPKFDKEDGFFYNIEKWILWRFQRLEYAGFDSKRTSTWNNVLILHGLCSMFRVKALQEVGGYKSDHLLEDYELTLKL